MICDNRNPDQIGGIKKSFLLGEAFFVIYFFKLIYEIQHGGFLYGPARLSCRQRDAFRRKP